MTSMKSEEKENKMINFPKTNVPALDKENESLLLASNLLEKMGNEPGLTADEFYDLLGAIDLPADQVRRITLAAVAIETMMAYDTREHEFDEPTIH